MLTILLLIFIIVIFIKIYFLLFMAAVVHQKMIENVQKFQPYFSIKMCILFIKHLQTSFFVHWMY